MTRQPSLFPRAGLPDHLRADFEAVLAAYPRRPLDPRREAEAAYRTLVERGTPHDAILRAVVAYAALCREQKTPPTFVFKLANFLSRGIYEDVLAKAAPPAAPAAPAPAEEDDAAHPLAALRGYLGAADWRQWLRPLSIVAHDEGDAVLLAAPTRFHARHVNANWRPQIQAVLRVRTLDITAREDIHP